MKFFRSLFNPLLAFIGIQLTWVLVVGIWVYWFLRSHQRLREIAQGYREELIRGPLDWVILAEGLVLLVLILAGVYVIFIYWRRQLALNREQKRFISQMTHELKSPLASLRLHLETIQMRHPPPEQLDDFLTTMLQDAERLQSLVDNVLTASRFEQGKPRLSLWPGDFSAFVRDYLAKRLDGLPATGAYRVDVTPGLRARFDPESMAVVLRNLLENAVLYSEGPPQIAISLRADGEHCHLTLADRGRGIEPADQKRVFRMFYRVRRSGESTRGTGLGLFIVWAVIRRHKGRAWAESAGSGQGTTFHILIPRLAAASDEGEVP